ncbi:alpha/beta fold hydrolase [Agromyces mariniharenae]|uniref:alpha/beta fold hydrolase n=1 Tax=Agromyces mariniharenae TaxID=2604423 RepID=UPI0016532EA4|nr:alpha/beta hydrolase [Agromyces mariniharenae]
MNPRQSSPSRSLCLAVALALTGVSVTGCTFGDVSAATPSATAEPAAYEASYEESPCPDPNLEGAPQLDLGPEYTCGYLTVPETRGDPDGRTVRIAVATVRAVSATPAADPIVYLDGGPGGTGLISAPAAVAAGMNAEHDVVFVDQRGTYHSEPYISCPEQDAFYAEAVGLAYNDPATGEKSDAATAACRERLVDDGVALDSYNTAENAADIADLRVAMGIEEWNIYGVSYGTDLALTVLRDHPEGVRSVVLDSVVPPNVRWTADFWPTSAAAFDEMYAACAAQEACAAAYPDLEAEFTEAVNRLDAEPLTVPVTTAAGDTVSVVVDGYKLANVVVLRLATGPAYSAVLPQMIHEIAAGDGTGIASSVIQYLPPAGVVGLGLQWGVFCSEDLPRTSLEEVVALGSEALPGFPESVLSLLPQVPRFFADCEIWDVPPADERAHAEAVSDVPALFLGGTFDAVTSPSWQDAATPTLSASQVVNFPGLGHQVILQDPCPVEVINSFLADPAAPVDEDCIAQVTPPVFTTP